MRRLVALALLVPCALAQEEERQLTVLEAVVMKVEGTVQGRQKAEDAWKALEVNATFKPGAEIRTGRKSMVALRLGRNATMVVDRHTRVVIPEIVKEGEKLQTRVVMSFGKVDVKVDRVGLDSDFQVTTPTATLAVRGTAMTIWWDVVDGFRAEGAPRNLFRSIEVEYLDGTLASLSEDDATSDRYRPPPLDRFFETYLFPLLGAVDPSAYDFDDRVAEAVAKEQESQELKTLRAQQGTAPEPPGGDFPPPGRGDQPPPTGNQDPDAQPPGGQGPNGP